MGFSGFQVSTCTNQEVLVKEIYLLLDCPMSDRPKTAKAKDNRTAPLSLLPYRVRKPLFSTTKQGVIAAGRSNPRISDDPLASHRAAGNFRRGKARARKEKKRRAQDKSWQLGEVTWQ